MPERLDFEPTQEIEAGLKDLFHSPEPDPRFLSRLENQLLSQNIRETRRFDPWVVFNRFSNLLAPLAWGTAVTLLVVGLVWSIVNLIPPTGPDASVQESIRAPQEEAPVVGQDVSGLQSTRVWNDAWQSLPTPRLVVPALGEPACARPESLETDKVDAGGANFCIVWVDPFDDENGFRILLQYGGDPQAESFVYQVGADVTQLLIPPADAPHLDEFQVGSQPRSSYEITVTALRPTGETLVGVIAVGAGGSSRDMLPVSAPTAVPRGAGKLAFVRDGNIWFKDLNRMLQSTQLTKGGGYSQPRWSPSGDWLAFRGERGRLWLMSMETQKMTPLEGGSVVGEFAWAPDIDLLAYVAGGELRIIHADGSGRRTQVSRQGQRQITRLAWSPDGRWIAYEWLSAAAGDSPSQTGLSKAALQGSPPVDLYTGPARLGGWTGDGYFLYFWQGSNLLDEEQLIDGAALALLPANGGSPQPVRNSVLAFPDFVQPDPYGSGRLAVVAGGGRYTWQRKTLSLLTNEPTGRLIPPASVIASPAWSSDGEAIVYIAMPEPEEPVIGAAARQALFQRRLWSVYLDGGQPWQLTDDENYRDEYPLWSSDGETILFVRMSKQEDEVSLWTYPVNGGEPKLVLIGLSTADLDDTGWFGSYGHYEWYNLFDWWR